MKHTSLNIHLYNETHLVKFPFGVPAKVLGGGLLLGRCLEAKIDEMEPQRLQQSLNGHNMENASLNIHLASLEGVFEEACCLVGIWKSKTAN